MCQIDWYKVSEELNAHAHCNQKSAIEFKNKGNKQAAMLFGIMSDIQLSFAQAIIKGLK